MASKAKHRWLNLGVQIGVIAAVSVALYLLITAKSGGVFDCECELTITPVSNSGSHIKSLDYATAINRESADKIAQDPSAERAATYQKAEQEPGHNFVANISYSGHIVNGVVTSHRPRFIVVFVTYDDGSSTHEIVKFPTEQEKCSVSVAIP